MIPFEFDGILAVNKPAGWTSHDVVAKLRRLLGIKRIGHAGTLDPDVTGVLPVAVGRSTRFIEYLQEMPKEYVAEMTIGIATDTEDISGTVTASVERAVIEPEELRRTIERFKGEIEQIPPMYSAVKIGGRKLYELAREGRVVERKPRKVTIEDIRIEEARLSLPHPVVKLRVRCSKGTYIRTLCKDIGEALGYPAVMSGLVRTMSCGIPLDRSASLEQIAAWLEDGTLAERMLPVDALLTQMPPLRVEPEIAQRLLQGQRVKRSDLRLKEQPPAGLVRLYAEPERFVGICRLEERLLIPHKMMT